MYNESKSPDGANQISVYRKGENFIDSDNDMELYLDGKKIMKIYILSDQLEGVNCKTKWISDKNVLVIFYEDAGNFIINITIKDEKPSVYYYAINSGTHWEDIQNAEKFQQPYDHKIKIYEKFATVDQKKLDAIPVRSKR